MFLLAPLELQAQSTWQVIMSSGITRLSAIELLCQKNPEIVISNAVQEYAVLREQLDNVQHDMAVYKLKIERILSQADTSPPRDKHAQRSATEVKDTSPPPSEEEKMRLLQEEARVSSERLKEIYQELLTVQQALDEQTLSNEDKEELLVKQYKKIHTLEVEHQKNVVAQEQVESQ